MSFSKPRVQVPTPRRFPRPGVEQLEDRLQPGSVLGGVGFSLLGSNLAGLGTPAVSSGDDAAPVIYDQVESTEKLMTLTNLSPLSSPSSGNSTGADTASSAAPVVQQNLDSELAPPLGADLFTLHAGRTRLNGMRLTVQPAGSAPVVMPAAPSAAAASQQSASGNAAVASPTVAQPQGGQQLAAPTATASPISAANLHHVTAAVVTQLNAGGQAEIRPDANVNWTTLVTSTTGAGTGRGVAVDSSGNVYTTGYTDDGTIKMAFVAEYSSGGSRVAFTAFQVQDPSLTYTQSEGHGIAVDSNGGIYVVGKATDALEGDTDSFIMKFQLDANNNLTPVAGYGGGIGGPFNDSGQGVVVDSAGEATMVGTYGISPTLSNVFAVKFTADGTSTIFANAYPVVGYDSSTGNAIALDSTGDNAYLAGSILPTGGDNDILAMQIDNAGGSVVYTATMVNPGDDAANGIAVDQTGHAYIAGTLASSGTSQAFVAQLSPDGMSILSQVPLTIGRTGNGISWDPSTGNVYVVGTGVPDASNNFHAFVEKLDAALNPHDIAFIAGSATEVGSGIAFDPNSGNAYVAGTTTSSDVATDGSTLSGTSEAFLSNVGSFN